MSNVMARCIARLVCGILTVGAAADAPAPERQLIAQISQQCDQPTDRAPAYTSDMWLLDSLLMGDIVVLGTPGLRDDEAWLHVDAVVLGELDSHLALPGAFIRLALPNRLTWDERGVWVMSKLPTGYYANNPTAASLSESELAFLVHNWNLRTLFAGADEHRTTMQIYHTEFHVQAGRTVWHGSNVRQSDRVISELFVHGERVLYRSIDREGRLHRIARNASATGRGFSITFHLGEIIEWGHWHDGKQTGQARSYYPDAPQLMREETQYEAGIRHGRHRSFDRAGDVVEVVTYAKGLIEPIVEPQGSARTQVHLSRSSIGVHYHTQRHEVLSLIHVGMTAQEVADIIGCPVSPSMGVHFPLFCRDVALTIRFEDGRVSAIRQSHNGVCLGQR